VKVGLFAPLVTPTADRRYLTALAEGAESRGFGSLWFGEHVVVFDDDPSPYPYSEDGRMPGVRGGRGLPEMFTTLAFLAARTERIRLGTGALILPIRHPVLTAKEAATLDWLSEGRLDLGVGLGWSRAEYEAMATPWKRRGDRSRAYLDLITRLWRDPVTTYDSEFYKLDPCRCDPKPVQPGGVPIWIGGDNQRAFERLAEFGQGWYAFDLTPEQVTYRLAALEVTLTEYGRKLADVGVQVCPYNLPVTPDVLAAYHEAGVGQVLLTVIGGDGPDQLLRRLDRAAAMVEVAAALG
jgi:probable F420-dependent oxidoreductase